jgi:hypothetical protein
VESISGYGDAIGLREKEILQKIRCFGREWPAFQEEQNYPKRDIRSNFIRRTGTKDSPNSNDQHLMAITKAETKFRMIEMAKKNEMRKQHFRNDLKYFVDRTQNDLRNAV